MLYHYSFQLLVHLHMTTMQTSMDVASASMIHFIETSTSILHEVPWIELKDFSVSAIMELKQK